MTIEEARDILKCEKNWEHRAGKKIHEALDIAIEALDQQTEYDRGYKDGVKDGTIGLLTDYNTACDYTFSGAKRLGYEEGLKDALEMTNEDCISRQAVIDEIFGSRNNFYNEFDQGFFADKIRALPPVTPQPKTETEESSTDCISRSDILDAIGHGTTYTSDELQEIVKRLLPVKPKFTDEEIQKMQDLEQAELEKAYELGKAEVESVEDCISRSEAIRIASGYCHWSRIPEELAKLPPVKPKERTGEWKQGEIDWYKLGKCIEEGFRKGLSNDRK